MKVRIEFSALLNRYRRLNINEISLFVTSSSKTKSIKAETDLYYSFAMYSFCNALQFSVQQAEPLDPSPCIVS